MRSSPAAIVASLTAVADGSADLAAIDCVTFALLERVAPDLVEKVRVLASSEPAPALPYITSARRPAVERSRLLHVAGRRRQPTRPLRHAREALLIDGFVPVLGDSYARSVGMAEEAAPWLRGLDTLPRPQLWRCAPLIDTSVSPPPAARSKVKKRVLKP